MKNKVNKQIIKALSVGLAASMALQPVTAFAETPEGETTNTGAATTTPTPAAAEAQSFDTQAQAATNAVNAASDALVAATPETPAQDYIPSAKAATDAEKTAVGNVLGSVGESASAKIDKKDVSVNDEYKAVNDELGKANTDLGTATSKIGDAQTANKAVEDYNKAVDTSIESSNDVVETLDKGTLTKIDGQDANVNVKEYGDSKKDVKGAINDANAAKTDYNSAEGLARGAFSEYGQVIVDSDNYIKNEATTDVSGEVLDQIKKDAAKCDKDLADAKDLVVKAGKELDDAQAEFDEANIALDAAQKDFEQAKADYLKVSAPDFGASDRAIKAAEKALNDAQAKFNLAKTALKTAEDDVKAKIGKQNSAKYAELVALQKEINDAKTDEAKATASQNFKDALIKYYLLGDDATDAVVTYGTTDYSKLGNNNIIVKEDGTKYYISGYDNNNQPIETLLPSVASASYVVEHEDGTKETVVRLFKIVDGENDSFTITDLTEKEAETIPYNVPVPAHYETGEGENAQTVEIAEGATVVEIKDANGKQTGAHVSNLTEEEKIYTYNVDGSAPQGTWTEGNTPVKGDVKYVAVTTANDPKVYYNTEDLPIGDAITEKVVTGYKDEQLDYKRADYDQWREDITKYCGEKGFEAIYHNRLTGKDYHFYENNKKLNKFFDELGSHFAGSFEIKYKSKITTDVPTGEYENVSASGIVVENYVTYDKYEYQQVGSVAGEDEVTTTEPASVVYKDDLGFKHEYWSEENEKDSIQAELQKHYEDNQVVNVTAVPHKNWKGHILYYTYTCTITTTTPTTVPVYDWVKIDTENVTTSKTMYSSQEYKYVEAGVRQQKIGDYYSIGYTDGQSKDLNSPDEKNKYDHQKDVNQAYVDAQTNFDATKKAFEEAQKKLDAAKNALANLKPAEGTKKDYVDAYNKAKKALKAAEDKKTEAEKALNAAKDAKRDADSAIAWADKAKTVADAMLTSAEKAKKAADDARNNQPGGGDDDDTPSTGGSDDTTPVVGPAIASNAVVTPAVAGDNAAVLGEVRKTSTRKASSKAAASTETVATDNSNGNSDNSAVAGAQKEETKTPEAPKEETKIEDNDTALAATPELEEKGFAWWWLLILAAIAGVSVEEYARRKSNKAKAEAKDSTKINK